VTFIQRTIALPGETIIELRIDQGNVFMLDAPARKILYGIIDHVREYQEYCAKQLNGTASQEPKP